MSVSRITPNLQSDNLHATARFYTEVLGMQVVMDHGWIITVADSNHPELQLSFMQEDATAPVLPVASIEVPDVDAVYATALSLKSEIIYGLTNEAWGVRRFFMRDPSGNIINVLSHLASYGNSAELVGRIELDMRNAMKDRDMSTVSTLKAILARFSNAEAVQVGSHSIPQNSPTGTPTGVGSTEVSRKVLSLTDLQNIIKDEINEMQHVIDALGQPSDYKTDLEQKVLILQKYLD